LLQKEIDDFISIFQNTPALALLYVGEKNNNIVSSLTTLSQNNNGSLKIKYIQDINCLKFKLTPREYEYAILQNTLVTCDNKNQFLKIVYHSLENSAQIIILEDKKTSDINQIKELLEQSNFLAINDIDIFEQYNLIIAKKMHMWSAGL